MDVNDVLFRFERALRELMVRDRYLLVHDVSERAITHKLAEYLQPLFRTWDVDCEYNRNGVDPKRIHIWRGPEAVRPQDVNSNPDVIVHERGTNGRNLLIVEAKKVPSTPASIEYDRLKIEAYARDLGYVVGIALHLHVGVESPVHGYRAYHDHEWGPLLEFS